MTNRDRISVIIPVYNSVRTIARCLNSVRNQTHAADYQIIVINDGSLDDSLDVINNYLADNPSMSIEIINKPNGGAASARNCGLKTAKGDWIALLDSDDEWLPNKIERQMEILKKYPKIDFLGGNLLNEQTRVLWTLKDKLTKVKFWELLVKVYPQTSTAIFKKSIIQEVGFYDETFRYYEDGDYWLRICWQKEFWFTPYQLAIYDGGKPGFGFSGLAANLAEMQNSFLIILKRLYLSKKINLFQYLMVKFYSQLKYFRRILIVKIRQ